MAKATLWKTKSFLVKKNFDLETKSLERLQSDYKIMRFYAKGCGQLLGCGAYYRVKESITYNYNKIPRIRAAINKRKIPLLRALKYSEVFNGHILMSVRDD